jgi:hypothetical protein
MTGGSEMDEGRLRQREVLEKFARAVVERHMAAPAIFLFESIQPLAFVAGQALAFVEPMLRLVLDAPDYTVFREAIEDRDNVRWLVDRLEELERGEE